MDKCPNCNALVEQGTGMFCFSCGAVLKSGQTISGSVSLISKTATNFPVLAKNSRNNSGVIVPVTNIVPASRLPVFTRMIVILDATESMREIIEQTARNINYAIDEGSKLGVRIEPGLIVARDLEYDRNTGMVDYGFFSNIDDFKKTVSSIRTIANDSNDENQFDAVDYAANKDWFSDGKKYNTKRKHAILITNSGSHEKTIEERSFSDVIERCQIKGMTVHVIGPVNEEEYPTITQATNGYMIDIDTCTPESYAQAFRIMGKTMSGDAMKF